MGPGCTPRRTWRLARSARAESRRQLRGNRPPVFMGSQGHQPAVAGAVRGRSAPIVMGNRVYVQNPSGRGPALQERVMALDADTGKVVWEYKFNIFQSDVPPHRVGWASPAADPETGNIYALGVGATLVALSADGKPLWQRSIGEEFAAFTTHGGRTMSPIIDGDLVIVSAAVSNWGTQAARSHRLIALNKRTGDIVYVANPGGRPVRHRVRGAGHRDDQRHAPADRRARRWRHSRDQSADRRKSLELRRRQARHQHRRRRERQHRHHFARRREPHWQRDGHDRRDRRIADRRHQDHQMGALRRAVRLLVSARRRHAPVSD